MSDKLLPNCPVAQLDYDVADECTVWPAPTGQLGDVEYALRYGAPTRSDILHAASVLNAYRALVFQPQARTRVVLSKIRKLCEESDDAEP